MGKSSYTKQQGSSKTQHPLCIKKPLHIREIALDWHEIVKTKKCVSHETVGNNKVSLDYKLQSRKFDLFDVQIYMPCSLSWLFY